MFPRKRLFNEAVLKPVCICTLDPLNIPVKLCNSSHEGTSIYVTYRVRYGFSDVGIIGRPLVASIIPETLM